MAHRASLSNRVLTVGHSNRSIHDFVRVLQGAGVEFLVDVRTSPYSRIAPQFNREGLAGALKTAGIVHVFEGEALGGRPEGDEYYAEDGRVLYFRMAKTPWFISGLDRVRDLAATGRVALMCSEEDPASCHRHLLIARVLEESGTPVTHLRADGTFQPYEVMADVVRRWAETRLAFPEEEDSGWRSTRSVSPSARRRTSSAR